MARVAWMRVVLTCGLWACVAVLAAVMAEARGEPFLRSNLARSVYHRMLADERLRTMDLSKVGALNPYCPIDWLFKHKGNKI